MSLISHRLLKYSLNNLCKNHSNSIRFMSIFPPKKKDGEDSPGIRTKELVRIREFFDEEGRKHMFDRNHFLNTLEDFNKLKKLKRFGYSEFIQAALPAMKEFGVHTDIESYKALMRVFPKGAFIPSSKLAAGFFPNYVQQQTAIKVMIQMEENGIMPDPEFESIIIESFSKHSLVWERCARMIYWMTKLKNANPYPFPEEMPTDSLELAIVALRRMTIYLDPQTEIYVYRAKQIDDTIDNDNDDTWICFAQSDSQCELIESLKLDDYNLSIDGPFNVWVKHNSISYFVLYAREKHSKNNDDEDLVEKFLQSEQEVNDVSNIPLSNFGHLDYEKGVNPIKSIHQQNDGTILSIVATGTSNQQSLLLWLRKLEQHNPKLRTVPIVITPNNLHGDPANESSSTDKKVENFQKNFDYNLHHKK